MIPMCQTSSGQLNRRYLHPISKDLTKNQVNQLQLFAETSNQLQLFAETSESGCQHRWRNSAATSSVGPAPSVADLTGRGPTISEKFREREIERQRQGLQVNETSSSEQLDVTLYNLSNLARQTIQDEAQPRMLCMLMNQTSHIMLLVVGSSLTVNHWDEGKITCSHI